MSETPESIEVQIEGIRREAGGLSDYHLDEALAVAVARRDVAAAHRLPLTADAWQELTLALDEVRRMRAEAAREIAAMTGPPAPVVRPLTTEELED
jgi:hypothetical protein